MAAFEFTALPDSYAARTGRPDDVGVIGVAVFTERPVYMRPAPERSWDEQRGRLNGGAGSNSTRAEKAAPAAAAAPPSPSQDAAGASAGSLDRNSAGTSARSSAQEAESKLGTGHGAREASYSSTTNFVRSSSRPVELVSIRYDRYETLARAGFIGAERPAWPAPPRPFPRSGSRGFVPDPPAW